ncbi:calcium-binding protein [Coleofasciculus sp. FACHB-SPT9]|uniref:calcium-binding protein n=1 Tax=Cyanophyceae TaxID=3028117 RepID=UPI001685EDAB|nr:calcium-binding protein [Coleofasciculus sp. FACHB-SPT9]MBD1891573.1 hypothetical protein [Coleofasciculus sp. FACHB-SPT9]
MATIYGSEFNDNNTYGPDGQHHSSIYGSDQGEEIYSKEGDDFVYAGAGDDYVDGWEGNDILFGFQGNDVLVAWTGKDVLYGGTDQDWLDGSYDDDQLYGEEGDDILGNAFLQGEPGNDKMYGGRGNDELYGGDGDDLLNGYGGGSFYEHDTLMGGANADQFILGTKETAFYFGNGNFSYATVVDFHKSQGDKIQVYGVKNDYRLDTLQNFSGSSALDTAIYYKNDLIGVVEDKTYTSRSELLTFIV